MPQPSKLRPVLPPATMAILSTAPFALMLFALAVGIPSAKALTAGEVRDAMSSDALSYMFYGVTPTAPNFLVLASINWRQLDRAEINLKTLCGKARLPIYTKYSEERSLQLVFPYDDMVAEVDGRQGYGITRYSSTRTDPNSIVGAASRKCFIALMPDGDGTTYVPDYQVVLAVWMRWWTTLRTRNYALIYATNQECQYPKDAEASPEYCTRIPEAVFRDGWNRYGAEYCDRILYMQDLDGTDYVLYDLCRDIQRVLAYADVEEHGDLMDRYITSRPLIF